MRGAVPAGTAGVANGDGIVGFPMGREVLVVGPTDERVLAKGTDVLCASGPVAGTGTDADVDISRIGNTDSRKG